MGRPIVIIGAGQGGLQAAESLRSAKYEGEILLLGDENFSPYNRPPLSKAFLLGEMAQDQLTIRQAGVFDKKCITLKTGVRVEKIDPATQHIECADGQDIPYEKLILATGSRARIPAIENISSTGVHTLRTLEDTLAIAAEMPAVEKLVVIGGGFIGLEMAAVARKLGKEVTVVEFADRLMARVVSPAVSSYYKKLHEENGVEIILNAAAEKITQREGSVTGVVLNNDVSLDADMVVLGVGVLPNVELAQNAGLECAGGIIIDNKGKTSQDSIYALGDCTAQRMGDGSVRCLESVQNAVEMAKAVASDIMGVDKPFIAAPWFWSDQYDVKLQMVGLSKGYDEMVVRGEEASGRFSYFYFKNGTLIAIDSFNQSTDHMAGRKLLGSENTLSANQARDTTFNLREALRGD